MSDTIFKLDKLQSNKATARVCPKNKNHGALGVHADGATLVCASKSGKEYCNYQEPASIPD